MLKGWMTTVAGVDGMWAAAGEFEGNFIWAMTDGVGGDYQGGDIFSLKIIDDSESGQRSTRHVLRRYRVRETD